MSAELVLLVVILVVMFMLLIGLSSLGGIASTFMLARQKPVIKAKRMVA